MDVTKVAGGIYREYWLRIIEREVLVKDEYQYLQEAQKEGFKYLKEMDQ